MAAAMSEPGSVRTRPQPVKRASVEQIQAELRRLWAAEVADGQPVVRASTHNLIIFVADEATAASSTQRAIDLTAERPGRVILVDVEPGDAPHLDGWVTLYCRPSGDHQICGEIITLAVRGTLRDEIHATVVGLLEPDLPVYLWWADRLDPEGHLYEELARIADRVLIDTDWPSGEPEVLGQAAALPEGARLGDLNWARLTPWRRLLTQLWDVPSLSQALAQVRSLDIHHAADRDGQHSNRALLLLGWLSDALGWELADAQTTPTGGYRTTWRRGEWQGKAEIVEGPAASVPSGELVGISIQAGAAPPYVMPRLEIMPGQGCIEMRLNEAIPAASRVRQRFKPVAPARALAEELDYGEDPAYRAALRRAADIVAAVQANKERL